LFALEDIKNGGVCMVRGINSISTGLGITTHYAKGFNYGKLIDPAIKAVDELNLRHTKKGQFLKWVELPKEQLKRVDYIYEAVKNFKNQSPAKFLTVIGIGGSKHPVEHMLNVNSLNLDNQVKFISDIDSVSHKRYMATIGNDVRNSNYLIVSKSGSTYEPSDAFIRTQDMMKEAYFNEIYNDYDAEQLANKHFVAVTDQNPQKSQLRRTADEQSWFGKFYIHDDVGGRFSSFDDHTLFTLAYAGMKKPDMIKMLQGADGMSNIAMSKDLTLNDPLAQAAFWVQAKLKGIQTTVHEYLGSLFENGTVNWHSQMQNESIKDTLKQIAKIPDAMHHSSEAHFNSSNKFAFALTSIADYGILKENAKGYTDAMCKTYSSFGPFFNQVVETEGLGLKPEAAGAMTQSLGFATVYQGLIDMFQAKKEVPEVLPTVIQDNVEEYKKNLKPNAKGESVVVAGRVFG
jgi:hypothetical protein